MRPSYETKAPSFQQQQQSRNNYRQEKQFLVCKIRPFLTKKHEFAQLVFFVFTTQKQELFFQALQQNPVSCRKIVVFVFLFCLSCATTVRTIFAQLVTPQKQTGHKIGHLKETFLQENRGLRAIQVRIASINAFSRDTLICN